MLNAVIYARYSSDNQREESIDAQLRICRRHCEDRNYRIVHEYIDEAFTATNDRRPDYQQMIKDAKKGGFQVAVFHKVNRNARNEYDYYFNKMQLIRAGVTVEYAGQAFDTTTAEGQLMENQLVGMAAYFSRNLSKEVKKGQNENALKCVHNGGTPPLGYDVGPDRHYVINEQEARAVRLIFDMYTNGSRYPEIVDECNRRGYTTKSGGEFRYTSLHDILANQKYAGFYVYGKNRGPRNMPRNGHRNCEDACVIEGGIPAIIDMDTWKKACACMDKHKRAPGSVRAKVEYLLSDLITCGECHQKMQGNSYRHQLKTKVKEYLYYRCPNCGRQIKGRPLEKQVIDVIRHSILNNRHIRSIVDSINVKLEESNMEFTAEIHSLQSQIATLEQSNDRLMGLLETGEISDLLIARIKKNSEKASAARQRLAELKEYSREVLSVEKVKAVINNWKMTNNEEGYNAMINTFVRSVTVYKDNIDVDLYLCIGSNEYTSEKLKKSLAK